MKRFIIAVMFVAMAAFATDARANNITQPPPPFFVFGNTFFINAPHGSGSFTDTFTFGPASFPAFVDVSLITDVYSLAHHIEITSAKLNVSNLTLDLFTPVNGTTQSARIFNLYAPSGATLIVTGNTGTGGGSYGGQATVTSVPEPASLMLLGAGLAAIGIWRRKATR